MDQKERDTMAALIAENTSLKKLLKEHTSLRVRFDYASNIAAVYFTSDERATFHNDPEALRHISAAILSLFTYPLNQP